MMTSPDGNIFRFTGPLWGESNGHWSFDVSFDLPWTNVWANNQDAWDYDVTIVYAGVINR